jgi:hypothetical protein
MKRGGQSLLGDIAVPAVFLAANTLYGKKRSTRSTRKMRRSRRRN